MTVRIIEN